jgi:hypothetical protein
MPRRAGIASVAALLAAVAPPPAARAATDVTTSDEGPTLEVVGACPDAAVVRRLLLGLLSPAEQRAAPVSIQDRGAHYRIAVRGAATTLDDPARDCAARAQRAAAVAAARLQDLKVVLGPPVWTIEKGLTIEVAPTSAGAVWAYGAEFRGAFGSGPWSLVGAAGARGPVTLNLKDAWKAELLRFPLDGGMRLTSWRWRLRPWVVLGASATIVRIVGHDLVETQPDWRISLGALAMAGATLRLRGRIGVAAALVVRWEPRPYQLQVVPHGTVGETPAWWFGLSLNYTIDGKGSSP